MNNCIRMLPASLTGQLQVHKAFPARGCSEDPGWDGWQRRHGQAIPAVRQAKLMPLASETLPLGGAMGSFQTGDWTACLISGLRCDLAMQEWEEGDGEYVAPELLRGCGPSPAADIYSLGATVYECLTGELSR